MRCMPMNGAYCKFTLSKKYAKPEISYARLMASNEIRPTDKRSLRKLREALNPFALKQKIGAMRTGNLPSPGSGLPSI